MEMNQMTGQEIGERTSWERTVLSCYHHIQLILIAGLIYSAVNQSEEYVRPDPPDKHSGHGKQCMALDYLGKVYIFLIRGP